MAKAVQALQAKQVTRIILTRPAVEAGERLGFLPGTLYEKIDPYLRPLYDALHDMLDPDSIPRLMAAGTIEVAPLAYMRGRAQPTFTQVLTPDGWRPIGDLQVGDLVVGSNGEPTPVLGVYPQGEKDIYRVTAQDGSSTLCCGEHLWTVRTASDKRRNKPWRVMETEEMIGNLRAAHARRYELPMLTAPVQFPERDVPMDPYALGLLLGDGCITGTTTPSFATADPELAAALEKALPGTELRHKRGVGLRAQPCASVPATACEPRIPSPERCVSSDVLGIRSHTKFVPNEYLHNSAEVRLALLQGLLDADGGPVTQTDRTCRIQYTTTSILLRDDVIASSSRWAGRPTRGAGRRWGRNPERRRAGAHRHDAHVLDIRLPEGIEPFRLARKRDDVPRRRGRRGPMRFIDSHRARGPRGVRVHPGGGRGLAVRHRGLPAYAQHAERRVHHPRRGAEHARPSR